jgi:hypothetical protein
VIGTNKPDSVATVEVMLADAVELQAPEGLHLDLNAIPALLEQKNVRAVTFDAWKRIDRIEVETGKPRGKPREKLTTIPELLEAAEV